MLTSDAYSRWHALTVPFLVKPHFPATPVVGTRAARGGATRWYLFYKPLGDA